MATAGGTIPADAPHSSWARREIAQPSLVERADRGTRQVHAPEPHARWLRHQAPPSARRRLNAAAMAILAPINKLEPPAGAKINSSSHPADTGSERPLFKKEVTQIIPDWILKQEDPTDNQ